MSEDLNAEELGEQSSNDEIPGGWLDELCQEVIEETSGMLANIYSAKIMRRRVGLGGGFFDHSRPYIGPLAGAAPSVDYFQPGYGKKAQSAGPQMLRESVTG